MNAAAAREQKTALRAFVDGLADMGEGLRKIVAADRTPQEIEAASEIQAKVHLGFDGRSGSSLLPKLLGSIGEMVSETADDFKIVTAHDVIITKDKLVIKRDVAVEGDDVALDAQSAFAAIRSAMKDWREAGLFDQ